MTTEQERRDRLDRRAEIYAARLERDIDELARRAPVQAVQGEGARADNPEDRQGPCRRSRVHGPRACGGARGPRAPRAPMIAFR
jgi:hypothetical protein